MGLGAHFRHWTSPLRLTGISGFPSFLSKHKPLLFGSLIGLALILAFKAYLKDVIVLLLLATVAIYSTIYKRYMRVPPAVELITFCTVMAGLAYGSVTGAIFGAAITILAEILNTGLDAFIVGYVPGRAAVGFVSAYFPTANIVTLGLLMSILYNAIAQPLYALQSDAELRLKLIAFVLINVPFNFIIFSLLGELVKGIVV